MRLSPRPGPDGGRRAPARTAGRAGLAIVAATATALWAGVPQAVAAGPADVGLLAAGPAAAQAMAANQADHDDPADHNWNSGSVVPVTLTGGSATSAGPGISVSGAVVTVTTAGTYQFTGTLTNGRIVVNATGTGMVRLILAGVTVNNSTGAALQVDAAGEVMVVLAAGTTNRLSDASSYVYPDPTVDEPNAALFSKANLTIAGTGTLDVRGNAYDGIASKDGLVVTGGTIVVNALDDGIRGKDYLLVEGGTVTVTAGGDGLKSDEDGTAAAGYVAVANGTVTVTASGDGVDAASDVVVWGGVLGVRAGGGSSVPVGSSSTKGIKAGTLLVVSEGRVTVDSSDDGVHSDGALTVDGGTVTVATGDDGLKAGSTLTVAAGSVTVSRSYEALEALKVSVTGGTVNVTATDDAVNAVEEGLNEFVIAPNAWIRISGGTLVASGGTDGLDSNGTFTLSGGTVVVSGSPTRGGGEGGLDSNGAATFTGGTMLSSGLSASTVTLPTSGQGWVSVRFSAVQAVGTIVHLATTSGTQLATFRAEKRFQEVVLTSNQITRGASYRVYTGGSVSGTAVGGGTYLGGTLSGTLHSTVVAGQRTGGGPRP
ncbi:MULTISPECIES: carbohydrate-binding domain-containing protein [Micromonospora]|uniref:Carbohydrate-binding domain-containing protein n=1 Tax=Micromonospora yangpuensis TaxID=683228 RepID=A0A1C6UIC1_9ACTN|nr:carbohydrate-binding domain-containing protein [Micromonospora yangpuensis]GGM03602.1 hypothetical protein GCM10012279_21650 [Micromonospora yangpuensis]SCL53639.1 protein of unknown function [Micromonospora yangpuensis]